MQISNPKNQQYCHCMHAPICLGIRALAGKFAVMSVKDIPNFEQMTDLERLQLAEDLIASVRNPEELPEPLAHRFELERRWAEYERNPGIALSEDQFWSKVNARKG
jgi:putative addiction module component (TIGR02574 family)